MPSFATHLDALANGYRAAQILFTANRLGLFAAVGRRRLTAIQLARALKTDPRATRMFCDALVALELLQKTGGRYRLPPDARPLLLPDSPQTQSHLFHHGAALYERWGRLFEVVKSGRPVRPAAIDPRLQGDERSFALAMASSGQLNARETVRKLKLGRARTLLDIGGGPGIYALEFARRYPRLRVTIFDAPNTLCVARENIQRAGLNDRVALRPGNALQDELGDGYDVIFVSNVVHVFSDAVNRRLTARCARALAPGGRLVIKDFLLDPQRTSPTKSALFAINMLVSTEAGDCFSAMEIQRWFRAAGLGFEKQIPLSPPSQMLVARRP